MTFALWAAAGTGGLGVIAGLIAAARGARFPARSVAIFSFLVIGILTVLPVGGSTDVISYAANGRMAVIGHSPYVQTPEQLKNSGDPIGQYIPPSWSNNVSVYGPVATAEEWAAAELGGTSVARVTFWLKLFTSIAFGAVALMLDRVLRLDPARRLRGHLLWTLNPLLLWEIVAGGHIDGVSAAFGLLGILLLTAGRNGERPALTRFLLAGLFIGIAAAIKIPYAAFGLGVLWAGRKSVTAMAAALGGFAVIFIPVYAAAGHPAVTALISRGPGTTWDTMYQIVYRPLGYRTFTAFIFPPTLTLIAALAFAAVALLAFFRFPDGTPSLPGAQPGARTQHRLALHVVLPAALVRRDGHLPAGGLSGLPAGLAGPAPPDRGRAGVLPRDARDARQSSRVDQPCGRLRGHLRRGLRPSGGGCGIRHPVPVPALESALGLAAAAGGCGLRRDPGAAAAGLAILMAEVAACAGGWPVVRPGFFHDRAGLPHLSLTSGLPHLSLTSGWIGGG